MALAVFLSKTEKETVSFSLPLSQPPVFEQNGTYIRQQLSWVHRQTVLHVKSQ